MSERRNDLDIAADIVRIAKEQKGVLKTHVQYAANLSWKLTVRYLEKMVSGGLLSVENKKYVPTKEGVRWLGYYERMMKVTPEELTG